ncbi:MAG: alanine racemase [Clostridia bacterium]|nr:alanine racemase [Clostridia bacterium]
MYVFINTKQLVKNAKKIKKHLFADTKLCAVVKANGYGHGMVDVAKTIQNTVDWFAVARVDEGLALRQNGITKPILVLCPCYTQKQAEICALKDISLTLDSLYDLPKIAKSGAKVHLKTDSGMHRIGVTNKDDLMRILQSCKSKKIDVQGVYTHFASDVNGNPKLTFAQYKKFLNMSDMVKRFYPGVLVHACNSANAKSCPAFFCDMVRVGLWLYDDVKQVTAKVVQIKNLLQGHGAGYDHCFVAKQNCSIAIVDCGYGDGLPRNYNGQVLTKYGKMDVVGNACMDMITIKNRDNLLKKGDKVVILGKMDKNVVKADEIAKNCGTISYEILCNLRER